jgi:hypothetical protein
MPNSQTPPLVNASFAREELPLRSVTLPCTWGSARKQCIFGLSESRFPISA